MNFFDVAIIGAGAVGNAVARELSKYELNICVIEKEADVAFGISGRNSGVLHAGFNNTPGTLMAELCVQGSRGFAGEAERLGIELQRTGKLVTALFEEDIEALYKLKEQGEANQVDGLEIISGSEIRKINENIRGVAALRSNVTGIFDPFLYTIALAEEACLNDVQYHFSHEVDSIHPLSTVGAYLPGEPLQANRSKGMTSDDHEYRITCFNRSNGAKETFHAKWIINSAGLFSDRICRMMGINDYTIHPCRGEYHILDKDLGQKLRIPVYPVPNEKAGGLGVHLTPTAHGNLMIGPSAEYIDFREDFSTTESVMGDLFTQGQQLFPGIERSRIIRSFSGIRPKLASEREGGYLDFVIEESEIHKGFVILAGIESPGLTASIPIARKVTEIIFGNDKPAEKNKIRRRLDGCNFNASCPSGTLRMICRCESISEMEIIKAYDDILKIGGIPTMKGIKNRTGAGMGNCQGSFCTVNIVDLLAHKRDVDPLALRLDNPLSKLFFGRAR